ncbi:MAG TPA: uroporphyrinogen-III synthase, partial [Alphaproteobacteria bacterium]
MRILITRPRDDAAGLAAKLTAAGHEVISEPMLEIRSLPDVVLDLEGVQAILFTSANGVRMFAALDERRDLPVFAVGDSTARAARDAGFSQVESAGGDVDDLVRLARERLQPTAGAVLHAAGRDVAGDLAGGLSAAGFEVRRAVLYTAEPVGAFSPATAAALRDGQIELVILYSARTAETFRQLIEAAGLSTAVRGRAAIGLSRAALEPVANLPWAVLEAASRPDEAELLRLVERQVPPLSGARAVPDASRGQPPKPPRQSLLSGRLQTPMVWLAVLLSLATFGLQTMQQSRPGAEGGAAGALRLDTRLAALERQIAALSRDRPPAGDPQIDGRLKQIEGRLAAMDSRPAASVGSSPDQEARIANLEQRAAATP